MSEPRSLNPRSRRLLGLGPSIDYKKEWENSERKLAQVNENHRALLARVDAIISASRITPITADEWTLLMTREISKCDNAHAGYPISRGDILEAGLAVARSIGLIIDSSSPAESFPNQSGNEPASDPISEPTSDLEKDPKDWTDEEFTHHLYDRG